MELHIQDLRKDYGAKQALKGISLTMTAVASPLHTTGFEPPDLIVPTQNSDRHP